VTESVEKEARAVPVGESRGFVRRLFSPLEYVLGPFNRQNGMMWLKLILLILALRWLLIEPFRIPSGSMEPTLYGHGNFVTDDRVAVNKLAYGLRLPFSNIKLADWGDPQRWDIVVFRSVEPPPPGSTPMQRVVWKLWPKVLIKRVVGLPGERIHIADGKVYVNGEPLELPPTMPPVQYTAPPPGATDTHFRIDTRSGRVALYRASDTMRYGIREEDEFSVVPPDSYLVLGDNSANSGDGRIFGWVPEGHILGRAFGIWWPLDRRRDFTGFTHTWWGPLLLYGIPALLVLYEITVAFVTRSWPLHTDLPEYGLRRGDRLRVSVLAYGLRLPFSRTRVTPGREPWRGELVAYHAPRDSEWAGEFLLGRVEALPGDPLASLDPDAPPEARAGGAVVPPGCYCVRVLGSDAGTEPLDCIVRRDFVGSVASVWWPLGRRRRLAPPSEAALADERA
jgi:signal peptidase I